MKRRALTRNRGLVAAGLLLGLVIALLAQQAGDRASAAAAKAGGGGTSIVTQTFRMTRPNDGTRFTVICPKGKFPFGGGIKTKPGPDLQDGEGIYPHSYERLGAQHGYHVTAILFDPSEQQTTPRDITLQVVCGPQLGNITPPHVTRNLSSGESAELVAKCPGRRHLVGGGFQRTNFTRFGGTIATESRAISSRAWRVSGQNLGRFDGELTAIAYCKQSKKPLLTTVSAETKIGSHRFGTATTPKCPKGRELTFGGWSGPDPPQPQTGAQTGHLLATDGSFNSKGSWLTSAYNNSQPTTSGQQAAKLTAYGYCFKL